MGIWCSSEGEGNITLPTCSPPPPPPPPRSHNSPHMLLSSLTATITHTTPHTFTPLQVESYDQQGGSDEDLVLATPAMRPLIKLAGVTLEKWSAQKCHPATDTLSNVRAMSFAAGVPQGGQLVSPSQRNQSTQWYESHQSVREGETV